MTDVLLVLNAGSSSVKFQIFGCTPDLPRLATGSVTGIGTAPILKATHDETGNSIKVDLPMEATQRHSVQKITEWVETLNTGWKVYAVAHRFVHGGDEFYEPMFITSKVFHKLKKLIPLALLHQPHHLSAVGVVAMALPFVPQIACFDTAFHATQEEKLRSFAIPKKFYDQGVHRYGFHGLSYAWAAQVMKKEYPDLAKGRVVVAHLGNGSSLCAIKNGKSIDTTMGMSVIDGLPMGTRCGAIDPGVTFYLMREYKMSMEQVENLYYKESGLKGLSGISNDVKALLDSKEPRAKFALDYFAMWIAKYIAAMAASMGGIDGIVFTGGIGENATPVREAILNNLTFMKIPRVVIIPANEERYMAEQAMVCMANRGKIKAA
ncbi:MAG: acetate/propionate family kinase [Bdellovibrionales bacterium]